MHKILVRTSAKYAPKIILEQKKSDTLDYALQIKKNQYLH